jgi:hypothetical protein
MKDDRRQTAWGLDNPASRDGARLLIKRINSFADNQNRSQVGMKDQREEIVPVEALQSISEAFEDLAARFIEPLAGIDQAMATRCYRSLYRLIASSFVVGYRSMEAGDKKLEFLKKKRFSLEQGEKARIRWEEDLPWWEPMDALAQQIRKEDASATSPKIAEKIASKYDPQFPGYQTLLERIRKITKKGTLAPAKKKVPAKKKGKRVLSQAQHPG